MVKRHKDSGFTLIELMIVIAVIGILAVVLFPKAGALRLQTKSSGVEVNSRVVQAFVQSRIDSWKSNSFTVKQVGQEILDAFESNPLQNPISNQSSNYAEAAATAESGTRDNTATNANALQIVAVAPASPNFPPGGLVIIVTSNASITITGYDANKNVTGTTTIVP